MDRGIRIGALGARIDLVWHPSVPEALRSTLRRAWEDLLLDRAASDLRSAGRLLISTDPSTPHEPGLLATSDSEALASLVSSAVTLRAIEHNRGRLVMLHAAGIAVPDGRVIAFVGPSGRGKTTLARTLGAQFGYVTDETLAVQVEPNSFGRVLPYRKPLSIREGGEHKQQIAPAELGLRPLPDAPLRLAAVVLLDRVEAGFDAFALEPADPVDGLLDLIPQLSYLSDLPSPLATIDQVITTTGGLQRLRYQEAAELIHAVPAILEAATGGSATRAASTRREHGRPLDHQPRTSAAVAPRYVPTPGVDWLDFDDTVLTLKGHSVLALTGIAPELWRHAVAGPADASELAAACIAAYGESPDHDPHAAITAALAALLEHGVLTVVGSGPPVPRAAGLTSSTSAEVPA